MSLRVERSSSPADGPAQDVRGGVDVDALDPDPVALSPFRPGCYHFGVKLNDDLGTFRMLGCLLVIVCLIFVFLIAMLALVMTPGG